MVQIGYKEIGPEGGHAAGRQLLQEMYAAQFGTDLPPIATTALGKPYFVGSDVHFSISHTARHVFCVLADCPVGLDAEEESRNIRLELAEKILSPGEKALFDAAEDKRQTLLRFWVLKEALVKRQGCGLQGYPNHTDFSPDDPRICRLQGCFVAVIT